MQYRASRFRSSGWEPAASHGARAPPAPATLVGAFGSAGEDLRHHDTCVPAAIAGSVARPTAMGDDRTARELAMLVTSMQVSGAGSKGACA
jgi:hypothetical protein